MHSWKPCQPICRVLVPPRYSYGFLWLMSLLCLAQASDMLTRTADQSRQLSRPRHDYQPTHWRQLTYVTQGPPSTRSLDILSHAYWTSIALLSMLASDAGLRCGPNPGKQPISRTKPHLAGSDMANTPLIDLPHDVCQVQFSVTPVLILPSRPTAQRTFSIERYAH